MKNIQDMMTSPLCFHYHSLHLSEKLVLMGSIVCVCVCTCVCAHVRVSMRACVRVLDSQCVSVYMSWLGL